MADPVSLKDKVALIVGCAGGIGAATARQFAEAGAQVIITHRAGRDKAASANALLATFGGGKHAAFAADVAETATLIALREAIAARYGRLDILVNTAGFTKPVPHAELDALDDELIDRMFEVNWRGQFATIRSFAPLLKASGDGLIVSVSSIACATWLASPIAHCSAKAGTHVMTKSLPRPLAPHAHVLPVPPGLVA